MRFINRGSELNFLNFWFRFVFRNRSFLEENRIIEVAAKVKEIMLSLLAKNYEKISGEILSSAILDKKIPVKFETYGCWWDKEEELDLVALNSQTNEIFFGEVKWSNKPIGTNIYEDMKKKSQKVEWGKKNRKEYFALFSKSGFTPDIMKKAAKKENMYLFHKDKLVE